MVPRKTRFRHRDGNPASANHLVLETDAEQRYHPHVCGDGAGMCLLEMSQRLDLKDLGYKGFARRGSVMTDMEFPAILLLKRVLDYHLT